MSRGGALPVGFRHLLSCCARGPSRPRARLVSAARRTHPPPFLTPGLLYFCHSQATTLRRRRRRRCPPRRLLRPWSRSTTVLVAAASPHAPHRTASHRIASRPIREPRQGLAFSLSPATRCAAADCPAPPALRCRCPTLHDLISFRLALLGCYRTAARSARALDHDLCAPLRLAHSSSRCLRSTDLTSTAARPIISTSPAPSVPRQGRAPPLHCRAVPPSRSPNPLRSRPPRTAM